MTNVKALQKQLFAAVAMVLVAIIAVSSSTFAWFANNTQVTATNMQVTATTSQSLVISNSALPTASTGTITVASSDSDATALIPTTHDSTWATYATGLKYNTNPGNVSASTGLVEEGKSALTFSAATNGTPTGAVYYKDYTVYIAANGGALASQDITIDITNSAVDTLMGATSIDFYYDTVTTTGAVTPSDSSFVGTLNLAELDASTNNATATTTTTAISNVTIPQAGAGSAIAVTMRVYVDGALKDSASSTFVKNTDIAEVAGQTLGVSFTATAHS